MWGLRYGLGTKAASRVENGRLEVMNQLLLLLSIDNEINAANRT